MQEFVDFLRVPPMLACDVRNGVQPLLDVVLPGGVCLQCVAVTAQMVCALCQVNARLREQACDGFQGLVERRQRLDIASGRRDERVRIALIGIVDPVQCGGRALCQPAAVLQPGALVRQRRQFASLEIERFQFGNLEAKQVESRIAVRVRRVQSIKLVCECPPATEGVGSLRRLSQRVRRNSPAGRVAPVAWSATGEKCWP